MAKTLRPLASKLLYACGVGAYGTSVHLLGIPTHDRATSFDAVMVTPLIVMIGPASDGGGGGFPGIDSQLDFVAQILRGDSEDGPSYGVRIDPRGDGTYPVAAAGTPANEVDALFRGLNQDSVLGGEMTVGVAAATAVCGPGVLIRRPGKGIRLRMRPVTVGGGPQAAQGGSIVAVVTYYEETEDPGGMLGAPGAGGADAYSGADGLGGIAGGIYPPGQIK